jgi:broad specificity phosphatase PhoE
MVDGAIWLARHGYRADYVDPDWRKTAQRPHDTPLSTEGLQQAQALAERLEGEGLERVFTSPFLRAVETAHAVAERLDVPLCIERGACEWLRAEWFPHMPELLAADELASRFPQVDRTYESVLVPTYPEDVPELAARCRAVIRGLAEGCGGGLLVVGHGASVMAMTVGLLDDPAVEVHATMCSATKLTRTDGSWTLELDGDRSHLAELDARQSPEMELLVRRHAESERKFNRGLRAEMIACWDGKSPA